MRTNSHGLPNRDAAIIGPTIKARWPSTATIDVVALRGPIGRCEVVGTHTLTWQGEDRRSISVDVPAAYVQVRYETRRGGGVIDVLTHVVSPPQSHRLHVGDPR